MDTGIVLIVAVIVVIILLATMRMRENMTTLWPIGTPVYPYNRDTNQLISVLSEKYSVCPENPSLYLLPQTFYNIEQPYPNNSYLRTLQIDRSSIRDPNQ